MMDTWISGNFEHLNYLGEIGKTVAARFKVWRYKCRRKSGKSPSSGSLDRGTHLHCFTNSLLSVVKMCKLLFQKGRYAAAGSA